MHVRISGFFLIRFCIHFNMLSGGDGGVWGGGGLDRKEMVGCGAARGRRQKKSIPIKFPLLD